jgi:hypothetical protein
MNNARHIYELKDRLSPDIFEGLFNGSTGHDLQHLQETAGLRRYLAASGNEGLLREKPWSKMGGGRAFSLRYGIESLTMSDAKQQVQFAVKLADLMLQEAAGINL